ncbi:MAG: tRNA (adenosine(37)-N6)-dimethylallyltransferase MiaA [Campylobacterota bacterium]|nr:tRNA (adenosine(37)-N6)-dimethylallyltransferase MiaA [Campylobacterota bacterium]
MKEFAIIAPTASGKTALSISLAHKLDAVVLSLDSLAVYKYIDIASAKPSLEERDGIVHFGIDKVEPNEQFDVMEFIEEYKTAKQYAVSNNKSLIIVGGTGFYLKSLIDGISKTPNISKEVSSRVNESLENLQLSYNMLNKLDSAYMEKIKPTDRYRIQKALEIYYSTNITPTEYFNLNKPKPTVNNLPIFQIQTDPDVLRSRIRKRTNIMIKEGIIDEVLMLEQNYTRTPNCMGSIGILETLQFIDGKIMKSQLEELISTHTAQLAKRQRTYNRSQFNNVISENLENLEKKILNMI